MAIFLETITFAILLKKFYLGFSQQKPWEIAVKKLLFSKNWTPLQACYKDSLGVFSLFERLKKATVRDLLKLMFLSNKQLHSSEEFC